MGVPYDDTYEYIGNKLYAYISYEVTDKAGYYISLFDYDTTDKTTPKEYRYTVKETNRYGWFIQSCRTYQRCANLLQIRLPIQEND